MIPGISGSNQFRKTRVKQFPEKVGQTYPEYSIVTSFITAAIIATLHVVFFSES